MDKNDGSSFKKGLESLQGAMNGFVFLLLLFFILFIGKSCDDAAEYACKEQCLKSHKDTLAAEVQPYRGFHSERMCLCYQKKGDPLKVYMPQSLVDKYDEAVGCCK